MSAIYFCNPGNLDLEALQIMGLNAKPNSDDPIGYFGTGMKMAFAVCARIGAKVTLLTNGEWWTLVKESRDFRDKQFDMLFLKSLDGEKSIKLPFTTELGKNWDTWTILRELGSNARDEGGDYYTYPQEDETTIIVEHKELFDIACQPNKVFLNERPIMHSQYVDVYPYVGPYIFYRGIRVSDFDPNIQEARYTYNIKRAISLTEDRTIKYPFQVEYSLCNFLMETHDQELLHNVMAAPANSEGNIFEHNINFKNRFSASQSEYIRGTKLYEVGEYRRKRKHKNADNFNALLDLAISETEPKEVDSPEYAEIITQQLAYANAALHTSFPADKIKVTERDDVYALYKPATGVIYLSEQLFGKSDDFILSTLIEEICHAEFNMPDESRQFQEFLCNRLGQFGRKMVRRMRGD